MTLRITKIEIRNFRPARSITVFPGDLAVLVGKNDSGKSNILRALNLFFTGHTGPAEELDFDTDHNVFNQPNRRAKQISIKLEIELPETYQDTNGHFITWVKQWRTTGLVGGHTDYVGFRQVDAGHRGIRLERVEIPDRSNLHALLRNINFVYVPAIKDLEYFSELRASIYNVIAEVADREFRDSSQGFERSISNQLDDLTTEIARSLGLRSRLALPKDLSHIFESLDFLSEGENISLDARGDGVKARHIPLILKFMADKKRGLQVRGAPPHTFIWAYEEPENNLELASCVELADQFWNFLDNGISQVLLTTHSPVFYNLHRKQGDGKKRISCHHIFRESDDEGTKEITELGDLDERMGTMSLFAPLVQEIEDRVRQQEEARVAARELAQANRRKLFVEGPSDKEIIEKALRVFAPDRVNEIDVETKNSAGVNYVVDMLLAWRSTAKHNPDLPRAAGLLDQDDEAKKAAREWNKLPDNVKSAKCFKLPTPAHLMPVLQAGFRVPIVLDTIYNREAWEWADRRGHLTDRDIHKVIQPRLANRILAGEATLDEHLDEAWAVFVKKEFVQAGKGPMARYFSRKNDDQFRAALPFLEPLISEVMGYLFPAEEEPPQVDDNPQPEREAASR